MPTVAASVAQLTELLTGAAHLAGDRLAIDDATAFRDRVIRDIAWTAAFSEDAETVDVARWLVWEASQELGARSASIQDLYTARPAARSTGSRSRRSISGPRRSTWPGPCSRPPRRPMWGP